MKNLQMAQVIRDVKRLVGDKRVTFNTLRSTTVDGIEYVAASAQYNDNAHLGAFFFATDYSNILDVVAALIRTAHNAPHNYSRTLPAYILTVTAYHDAPTRYTLALVTENCWEYPTQGLRISAKLARAMLDADADTLRNVWNKRIAYISNSEYVDVWHYEHAE